MGVHHVLRYVLVGVALVVLVSLGWRHRNDAWVQGLLRPPAPAKAIVFDNGSVRATLPYVAEDATSAAQQQAQNNLPGILKKCIRKSKVVYTDQPCPDGFSAEQVSGDKVTVMESGAKPSNTNPAAPADPRKTLHDALDLSGNDNIKDKMMDRAINR
ncbi:MAG: hypothetical protein IPH37_09300 [Burkholderiales bacterium]|nr:hypothetical protein [Burkholderiales bacterium]MBK9345747.1 hypothetical protein [Burkholderiales bacterium]